MVAVLLLQPATQEPPCCFALPRRCIVRIVQIPVLDAEAERQAERIANEIEQKMRGASLATLHRCSTRTDEYTNRCSNGALWFPYGISGDLKQADIHKLAAHDGDLQVQSFSHADRPAVPRHAIAFALTLQSSVKV